MQELELKAAVPNPTQARLQVLAAGAELEFDGRYEDRRYDTADRRLNKDGHMLRVRAEVTAAGWRGTLTWKGPTTRVDGYKAREEIDLAVGDPDLLHTIVRAAGFRLAKAIDRDILAFSLAGASLRFERYPRMDTLVEVEGMPAAIEAAIAATGLPRAAFTAEKLGAFMSRFATRAGAPAVLSEMDLPADQSALAPRPRHARTLTPGVVATERWDDIPPAIARRLQDALEAVQRPPTPRPSPRPLIAR